MNLKNSTAECIPPTFCFYDETQQQRKVQNKVQQQLHLQPRQQIQNTLQLRTNRTMSCHDKSFMISAMIPLISILPRLFHLILVSAAVVLLLLCWPVVSVSSFVVPSTICPIQHSKPNNALPIPSFNFQTTTTRPIITNILLASSNIQDVPLSSSSSSSFPSTDSSSTSGSTTTTTTTSTSTTTIGNWEEIHGNYLLRPKLDEGPPRALLHFLGGAIVGKSPHIAYRYILERLASKGYVIVATPYNLSFDYLLTCDDIISRFERIATPLARTYGALPVIGIGHSCGSLLQVLITSLFPDTPRAANALISYNNKPVSEAVPFFDEFFAPFFTYVAARNETSRSSGSDIIRVGLDLASYAVKGELPSDDLLTKAGKLLLVPTPLSPLIQNNPIVLPVVLRNSYKIISSPATTAITNSGLVPLVTEVIQTLQQIPMLIDEVADGAKDFIPPSAQVKAAARRSYRARRTLIIQYQDDPIDESIVIEELLQTAGQIVQMKRPMIPIDVQLKTITGNHATPCLAPPLDIAIQVETLLGSDTAKGVLFYASADQTVQELIRWLEEANL